VNRGQSFLPINGRNGWKEDHYELEGVPLRIFKQIFKRESLLYEFLISVERVPDSFLSLRPSNLNIAPSIP
jgi:hypothetical protein